MRGYFFAKIIHLVEVNKNCFCTIKSEKTAGGPVMCPLIGEVRLFPYGKIPAGWLPVQVKHCISPHTELYMLIGTRFGGDGKQNFKLPDLQKSPDNDSLRVEGELDVWGRRSVFQF